MSNAKKTSGDESPWQNFCTLLNNTKLALNDLPKWERGVHIFWLLGPLILLIERTPADIWLSLLALLFVARSTWLKEGAWLRYFWVRAAFAFWAICLLSAALSVAPSYALGEAFAWFRFPLFAMATVFWFSSDKRLLYAMFLSTGLGMMVMTLILTAELVLEGHTHGRLTWPYGDLVPGNYLAKAGLPAFCVMVALAFGGRGRTSQVLGMLAGFTLSLSVLAGERMNLIIRICAGFLAGLSWRFKWQKFVCVIILSLIVLFSLIAMQGSLDPRFTLKIAHDLPFAMNSDYYRKMGGGVIAFLDSPLLGIGTASYRDLCPDVLIGVTGFRCDNHPHNYYIQMLAEVGILGFAAGVVMITSMIVTLFRASRNSPHNVIAATAYIVPFGLFFPIQSTADFFGQWNNIFLWSAVALSMAAINLTSKNNQSLK